MNLSFDFERFYSLLDVYFASLDNVALVDSEQNIVFLKYTDSADIGALPQATTTAGQYLNLKHGEICLLNDVYSGGSQPSDMILVMGLEPSTGRNCGPLLLSHRLSLKPNIRLGKSYEDEGIRIPPTPIYSGSVLNEAIVAAIESHPLCPENFSTHLIVSLQKLQQLCLDFATLCSLPGIDFSKNYLKKYHIFCFSRFSNTLHQLVSGEACVAKTFPDGSELKLRLETHDDKVLFDFSGTGKSSVFNMTDSATLSACVGALLSVFNRDIPVNSGLMEHIDLRAPQASMVNCKYPSPVLAGMLDGTSLVANTVLLALGQIDSGRVAGQSSSTSGSISIEFENGSHFFDQVLPGGPSMSGQKGENVLNLWSRSQLRPSVEEIERRYPLTVMTYGYKSGSGGAGIHRGGHGGIKSYKIHADGKLRWLLTDKDEKPQGTQGGKAAHGAHIIVRREAEELEPLGIQGEFKLKAGDILQIVAAGGGGLGQPEEKPGS